MRELGVFFKIQNLDVEGRIPVFLRPGMGSHRFLLQLGRLPTYLLALIKLCRALKGGTFQLDPELSNLISCDMM